MRNVMIISLLSVVVIASIIFFHSKEDKEVSSSASVIDPHSFLYKERMILPDAPIQADEEKVNIDPIIEKWNNQSLNATLWGENVPGVHHQLNTEDNVIALTFDACGGPTGNGYDEQLISFLREEQIRATLFFNARWIEENKEIFMDLSSDPLFSIQNHGTEHRPLSITGQSAWNISGTDSPVDVVNEVMVNQQYIYSLTGEKPTYFRSGTAFYDEIAVQIVEDLGLKVVNYDILGDAGATYSSEQVKESLLQARPGSIALLHMNHPSSGTAEGVMAAIPLLREQGFEFVTIDDYELRESEVE
ncbi:polysaccharide deacetylase family protein [Evansella cellulosilytica]|uniref:Polysaccharide deacetylase n=1 Tax=Evansella cellulosilytica (strain ATCC 21833 / DSM 2522 / FERM P-1141 / JCM 9156 / N-4) TaxID=649639 RepID=E6U1S7_EVAC2|nr:polysaccharide deacetylase family protein [Evansella cellulosilytica]ADU31574.1 polysaccharide deacetylase [Evansella cellulosilytica DSM 2522]